ncbi:OmpA family protein [Pajaroellobacter abortibovis]|uniref:OmpA-like domain-containing protein n=1 Tax=Pajaroellobacter abortibovis TaxID=1882918 RepID=A0A1L6MY20_9BACT|nr:OmpA family protein [Pajaroellobacter abortibovis]APS00399.1 hypothetical protein BCY86_06690 [Pajaroellobacter abortibovis]
MCPSISFFLLLRRWWEEMRLIFCVGRSLRGIGPMLLQVVRKTILSLGVGILMVACGRAKSPLCEKDEECQQSGRGAACVQGKCVECRTDSMCHQGNVCQEGVCKPPVSSSDAFCDDAHPCEVGYECGFDRQCHAKPPQPPTSNGDEQNEVQECDEEHLCPTGERCVNGHCIAPREDISGCETFFSVYFAFDSRELQPEGKAALQKLAQCLTSGSLQGSPVVLTGHCDPRGEPEYNMVLGADRAKSVHLFLLGLGVSPDKMRLSSRGKLDAKGIDEATWAQDRRVDIEVGQ